MTKNKITEGNAFSLCINQAVWAEIGGEETPIPANELEDVHLYIGRGPYKAKATEYKVMASGDTLIAYIDHTLKVGVYSTWITAYCNGRRVASNCKEAFEIVSFDEHCSNVVNEVYVCPAIYLQGTVAADEAIRQLQEAERVAAEEERKKTFNELKASLQSLSQVQEDIFALCDSDGNISLKYDNLGFDVAKISEHFALLIQNILPPYEQNIDVLNAALNTAKADIALNAAKIVILSNLLQSLSQVQEDIFALCDSDGNVALKYDDSGFDVAKISEHFTSLLSNSISNNLLQVIEVDEPGIFYVDAELNVGEKRDNTGTHAINLVEYINQ